MVTIGPNPVSQTCPDLYSIVFELEPLGGPASRWATAVGRIDRDRLKTTRPRFLIGLIISSPYRATSLNPTYGRRMPLAGQLPQKFPLVHAVFEGLTPVDEDDRDFVIELPAQFVVAINIHFLPREAAAAGEFREAFLHQLAKMTTLPRVNHDLA